MARLLFRASRFLLMAAPAGLLGVRFGGLLFIGVAAYAASAMQAEYQEESKLEARMKAMPAWTAARSANSGPVLAAWQKWLLVWGSWGWKGEPLLARSWFARGKLIASERSYMLVDGDAEQATSRKAAVIALLAGLSVIPLAVIALGWTTGAELGAPPGSAARRIVDVALLLLIVGYVVLTQIHEQIYLFTSVRAQDPELEAMARPAQLRISYMPQPAKRWLRAGTLDRAWRKVILINAIDYERLPRDEVRALVAHEVVHLRKHHDLLFGVQLRLIVVGLGFVYWLADLAGVLPPLPAVATPASAVIFFALIAAGLALPFVSGRYAERQAYLGAADGVGAAPVLRLLRADDAPRPAWIRDVMKELDARADAEARKRGEDGHG